MNAMAPDTNPAPPPVENYTDLPVGEILRRTRVHFGQTLEDASGYLRIRASQLEALEKGDIDKLPGRAYAIGYVRTYSEYLGLDGEKMIQLFKMQSGGRSAKPDLHFPVPASESKGPNVGVIIGSLAVLVLVIGVWLALNASGRGGDVDVNEVPNVPADIRATAPVTTAAPAEVTTSVQVPVTEEDAVMAVQATPETVVEPSAAATAEPAMTEEQAEAETEAEASVNETPVAPEQKREITINVKERTWVEVRDRQGKAILSRILKPGEVFLVPEENYGLSLDTGNAGGLELLVNGEPLMPLGGRGDILRDLVLDGDALAAKYLPKDADQ